jgi:hypothetical protein
MMQDGANAIDSLIDREGNGSIENVEALESIKFPGPAL